MTPKVFVSHAKEDKERFVIDFARKLRNKGIDAWVDQWEMLPGDSLIDKIFEEGIKNADAFIVVLSEYSSNKPWVREEINASFVNRISRNCKIIPVVIDRCNIPECLNSTVWENIKDINDYEKSFDRIVNSIFGVSTKPAIGSAPAHINTHVDDIYGLTKIDTIVLYEACNIFLQDPNNHIVPRNVMDSLEELDISDSAVMESLEFLDSKSFIKAAKPIGGGVLFFSVTTYGFEHYARSKFQDYDSIVKDVSLKILNQDIRSSSEMIEATEYPVALIHHIFDSLMRRGHIDAVKTEANTYYINNLSIDFKRMYR